MRSLIFASLAFSLAIASAPGFTVEYAGLTDELGSATVSILGKLGYDCTTAEVGIVCKKCKVEDDQQKCEAYLCDAVTQKCRKKSAEIPKVPGLSLD